jgi:hypothetical protein
VYVCSDPTMAIDSSYPQANIFYEFVPGSGAWNSATTTETISFSGGCTNAVPVPTCFVSTDACSASATDWDSTKTKVKCTVNSNPAYQSTTLDYDTSSEFEVQNLRIVWVYNGQVKCSNTFNVQVCRD